MCHLPCSLPAAQDGHVCGRGGAADQREAAAAGAGVSDDDGVGSALPGSVGTGRVLLERLLPCSGPALAQFLHSSCFASSRTLPARSSRPGSLDPPTHSAAACPSFLPPYRTGSWSGVGCRPRTLRRRWRRPAWARAAWRWGRWPTTSRPTWWCCPPRVSEEDGRGEGVLGAGWWLKCSLLRVRGQGV